MKVTERKRYNPLYETDFGFERECHFLDLVKESLELSFKVKKYQEHSHRRRRAYQKEEEYEEKGDILVKSELKRPQLTVDNLGNLTYGEIKRYGNGGFVRPLHKWEAMQSEHTVSNDREGIEEGFTAYNWGSDYIDHGGFKFNTPYEPKGSKYTKLESEY